MLQVHRRLQEAFDAELPMIELFAHPSVRSIAAKLAGDTAESNLAETQARGSERRERLKNRRRR